MVSTSQLITRFSNDHYVSLRQERKERDFASRYCCKGCKRNFARANRSKKNSAKFRERKINRDLKGVYMYV